MILKSVSTVILSSTISIVLRSKDRATCDLVVDLHQVILKEREEKKRMRLIGDCDVYPDVDIPDDADVDEADPDPVDPEHDLIEENNAG